MYCTAVAMYRPRDLLAGCYGFTFHLVQFERRLFFYQLVDVVYVWYRDADAVLVLNQDGA